MVRTKADSCPAAGRKVVAASAPRKSLGASSSAGVSSTSSPSANKYGGGNPVCPRPTPEWQKGINAFFTKKPGKENEGPEEEPGCSASLSGSSVSGPNNNKGGSSSEPCAGSSSTTTSAKAKRKKRVSRIDSSEEDE